MKVRYDCISGFMDDEAGLYESGDVIPGAEEIGEVIDIIYPCPKCEKLDCECLV